MLFLNELKIGESAQIIDLKETHALIQARLHHLGISEACEVCMKNKLPFGGPCMIECGGQCISMRQQDLKAIQVRKI